MARRGRRVDEAHETASYYLPTRLLGELRAHCAAHGISKSQAMTEALALFLAVNIHKRVANNRPAMGTEGGEAA